jgi:hypothetical protein
MKKTAITEKLELFDELNELDNQFFIGLPTGLLRHALLYTIDLFELTKFYIHEGSQLRSVSDNICKRLEKLQDCKDIYDYIFDMLKQAEYKDRLRFRRLLDTMVLKIDETRQLEYISYFLGSKYSYEVASAISISGACWNEHIKEMLMKAFLDSPSEKLLCVLVEHVDKDSALSMIQEYWTPDISKRMTVKFMNRLKGSSVKDIDFLKTVDPANFIALLRFSTEQVEDDILRECYVRIPEKKRPFALWNLGVLGRWELIAPEIRQFVEAPTDTFNGFSDNLFEK